MYQALYRKWRPAIFGDVYGQPHITVTLRREVAAGRVGHAYLFTGTRGTGKTTCAKILAKAVNCLSPSEGDPCNVCENCRGIQDGSIFDVLEIDAASNNGVDNIRDLREEAVYTPAKAKRKVYIVDEVHMLSQGAFNALLKTLEEPPSHVMFILATTEVHKLPATILSRCQRFDFKRISLTDIIARLSEVAEKEGIECEKEALSLIARLADGALRDALSLLDQCAGQGNVTVEHVMQLVGYTDREYLHRLSFSAAKKDIDDILGITAQLYSGSKDMSLLCSELMEHYRDLMAVMLSKDPETLLDISKQESQKLAELAALYSLEHILYAIRLLAQSLSNMSKYKDKRAELEMCLVRIAMPQLEDSRENLSLRVKELEKRLENMAAIKYDDKTAEEIPVLLNTDTSKKEQPPIMETPDMEKALSFENVLPESSLPENILPEDTLSEDTLSEDLLSENKEKSGEGKNDIEDQASKAVYKPFSLDEVMARLREMSLPQLAGFLKRCNGEIGGRGVHIHCPDDVCCEFLSSASNKKHIADAVKHTTKSDYNIILSHGVSGKDAKIKEKDLPELTFDDGGSGIVEYI